MFRIRIGLRRIRHILPPGAHKVLPYGIYVTMGRADEGIGPYSV